MSAGFRMNEPIVLLRLPVSSDLLESPRVLISVETVHHVVAADPCPDRREMLAGIVECGQTEHVLKEHGRYADRRDRPRDQTGDRHAMDAAAVDNEASATTSTVAELGCSNSRTMSGLKFVNVDCGQSMVEKRSPPASPVARRSRTRFRMRLLDGRRT
jgi:hypothetical protein